MKGLREINVYDKVNTRGAVMRKVRVVLAAFCVTAACVLHAYEINAPLLFEWVGVNLSIADFQILFARRGMPITIVNTDRKRSDVYGFRKENCTVRLASLDGISGQPWIFVGKGTTEAGRVLKITLPYADDASGAAYEKLMRVLIRKYGEPAQLSTLNGRKTWVWVFTDGMMLVDRVGKATLLAYYSAFGLRAYQPMRRYRRDPRYSFFNLED